MIPTPHAEEGALERTLELVKEYWDNEARVMELCAALADVVGWPRQRP
jgi:hypothetical protein